MKNRIWVSQNEDKNKIYGKKQNDLISGFVNIFIKNTLQLGE
jgi:hypothetical protein